MSNGTTEPLPVPRYNIMLTSGIMAAGTFGIGLICLTVYAASPSRPLVTSGLTAICAVAATVGTFLIVQAVVLRKVAKIRRSVDDHGHNVFVDHHALHRDAVENQAQIGLVFEALGRVLAFQEQNAHVFTECREHIGDLRQQVADLSLDYGKQLEELKEAMTGLGADLAAERLEGIVVEAIRKAYTNGYIDALDSRPPQAPDNVRRLPGPDQR